MKNCLIEEKKYEFPYFNAESALKIGSYCVEYSKKEKLPICIDIHAYSKTLYHFCSNECSLNNEDWLRKKRNTVLYFHHSTKFLSIKNGNDATLLQSKYGLENNQYCITMGGFPIALKDSGVVGAICVSGLAPEEDHNLVMILLNWYFENEV